MSGPAEFAIDYHGPPLDGLGLPIVGQPELHLRMWLQVDPGAEVTLDTIGEMTSLQELAPPDPQARIEVAAKALFCTPQVRRGFEPDMVDRMWELAPEATRGAYLAEAELVLAALDAAGAA